MTRTPQVLPRLNPSNTGPVWSYLQKLLDAPDAEMGDAARSALNAVRNALSTPDGAILLELLEKSTTDYFLAPSSDERALSAINAQRFIALDLRRIMSNETRHLLSKPDDPQRTRRSTGRGS